MSSLGLVKLKALPGPSTLNNPHVLIKDPFRFCAGKELQEPPSDQLLRRPPGGDLHRRIDQQKLKVHDLPRGIPQAPQSRLGTGGMLENTRHEPLLIVLPGHRPR